MSTDTIIVISISVAVIIIVFAVIRDLCAPMKGVGEQTVESDERIERENEILMSRMIDYSENTGN